ncbi:hypothetical protein ACX1C1_03900 [Paenibacillus sp. strain BS8-2]
MLTTPNFGMKKPEYTDVTDINDFNDNFDILDAAVGGKVDKVTGKQLSTEDYTAAEKSKLAGIAAGAQPNAVTSVAGRTGAVVLAAGDIASGTFAAARLPAATTSAQGALSPTDKTLIDGATANAAANTLVRRDANGRYKAGAPSASDDVARKAETDALATTLSSILNPARAEYRSNLDKACPTFEWTSPDWNMQTYDTDIFLDPVDRTKININTSGLYLINALVTIEENENGQRNIQVVKNADNEAIGYLTGHGSANATRLNITTTAFLNAGEYIRIRVYQDDFPNTLNILGTSSTGPGSKFSIVKLCPP